MLPYTVTSCHLFVDSAEKNRCSQGALVDFPSMINVKLAFRLMISSKYILCMREPSFRIILG